jgi:SAM-dependent methyltransferase
MYGEGYEEARFSHPSVRRRLAVMERIILERTRGCGRVLDIGCGTGRFTLQLSAGEVVGLDKHRRMLSIAFGRGLPCVLGDAHALPFADGAFDAVVATDGVFGFVELELALAEAARVLAPGGLIAIHYPANAIWTPRRPLAVTRIDWRQSPAGSRVLVAAEQLGLVMETMQLWRWLRWYPYLLPVPAVVRLPLWNAGVFLLRKQQPV